MELKELLLNHIDEIHTTVLGIERIKRNLNLENEDVVNFCKDRIKDDASKITRVGKNYYVELSECIITINAYSYTIITAHKNKGEKENEKI